MGKISADMIRERYTRSKPNMPADAYLVMRIDFLLRQRSAIGTHSVGRTRDELLQQVCEDEAKRLDPRTAAEALFAPPPPPAEAA